MRLLLLDTCADHAGMAFAENDEILRSRTLPPRAASAQLIGAIREDLQSLGWPLASLHAVGVVNGPGSFTGVRIGLAAAKGLCEVANLKLAVVSRLAVLFDAADGRGNDLAVLDAGRSEFYVRSSQSETLLTRTELTEAAQRAGSGRILVAETKLMESLGSLQPVWVELSAASALRLIQERLSTGGDPVDRADANYVRGGRALYPGGTSSSGMADRA